MWTEHTFNALKGVYLAVNIDISSKMHTHARAHSLLYIFFLRQKLSQNHNKEFHFSWLAIYNSSTKSNSFDNNKNTIDVMGWYTLFLFNNHILLHKEKEQNRKENHRTLISPAARIP